MYLDQLPLKTVSKNGVPPKTRMGSSREAVEIVQTVIDSNRERLRFWTRLKGASDGNAPYDSSKLRNAGQGARTNINFLEFGASVKAACVPYYELFSGSNLYCDIKTDHGNDEDREWYSRVISEEFDWLLRQYDAFDYHMQRIIFDRVLYGAGFIFFDDTTDWRFRSINRARVLTLDGTEISARNLEVLVVRESFKVHWLWGKIKNRQAAKDVGWNEETVLAAIQHAMPRVENNSGVLMDYEYIQQRIADHDIYEGVRSSTVQGAHLLIREFDGKVSHFIVPEDPLSLKNGDNTPRSEFLFKNIGRFENWNQALSTFFMETQDGSWNGAYGLGKEIFAPTEIKNRLVCSAIDNTFMRSGITMQARSATSFGKTSLIQLGNINVLPPDFDVQQATIFGDVDSLLNMDRSLEQKISSNTGVYRQKMDAPTGNPRTAEEVRLQFQNGAMLGNAAVNRFYLELDKLYREIYRRASNTKLKATDEGSKLALEFQKRCIAREVPKEALTKIGLIHAYRNIGNGSLFMKQQAIAQLASFYGALPESGKMNYLEDVVATTLGQSMVRRYVPKKEKSELPNDQQAEAMLENAAMKIGAPVLWTPTQNNVIHLQTHFLAASQALAGLEQGANPMDVYAFVDMVGQHGAQHLAAISQDPGRKNEYKILSTQWKQLASTTDQLGKMLQDRALEQQEQAQEMQIANAQAQQIEQGMDPESRIAMAKAQQEMGIKQAKSEQALAIKDVTARQKMAIADMKAQRDLSKPVQSPK